MHISLDWYFQTVILKTYWVNLSRTAKAVGDISSSPISLGSSSNLTTEATADFLAVATGVSFWGIRDKTERKLLKIEKKTNNITMKHFLTVRNTTISQHPSALSLPYTLLIKKREVLCPITSTYKIWGHWTITMIVVHRTRQCRQTNIVPQIHCEEYNKVKEFLNQPFFYSCMESSVFQK